MLKRLQAKKSNFDVTKWHKDEHGRQKLLGYIKKDRASDAKRHQAMMDVTLSISERGNMTKSHFDTSINGGNSVHS
jgi:hypothetical protein